MSSSGLPRASRIGRQPGIKWTFSVPMTLGQFPAAALMFRKAYVQEGPVVVHEERGLAGSLGSETTADRREGCLGPEPRRGPDAAGHSIQSRR